MNKLRRWDAGDIGRAIRTMEVASGELVLAVRKDILSNRVLLLFRKADAILQLGELKVQAE